MAAVVAMAAVEVAEAREAAEKLDSATVSEDLLLIKRDLLHELDLFPSFYNSLSY
jgi:hypothetical protein